MRGLPYTPSPCGGQLYGSPPQSKRIFAIMSINERRCRRSLADITSESSRARVVAIVRASSDAISSESSANVVLRSWPKQRLVFHRSFGGLSRTSAWIATEFRRFVHHSYVLGVACSPRCCIHPRRCGTVVCATTTTTRQCVAAPSVVVRNENGVTTTGCWRYRHPDRWFVLTIFMCDWALLYSLLLLSL